MTRALRYAADRHLLLPAGTAIALMWANTLPASYFTVSHRLAFAVNDVAMAWFFALMMREVVEAAALDGPLHSWRRLLLAVIAAGGGVLGATLTYAAYLGLGDEASLLARGWPIVCATDIAFTYGLARTICHDRAMPFLVLIGIVSNAVAVIGVAVTAPIGSSRPAAGAYQGAVVLLSVAVASAIVMRRCAVRSFWPYVLGCGALSWLAFLVAGLHPALALVPIVPFLDHTSRRRVLMEDAPARARDALSRFHRVSKYPVEGVLFMFGLVNAGVLFRGAGTGTWAVLVAALGGRPAGMLVAVAAAATLGLRLPRGVGRRDVIVIAIASSIGFTFALFFATAAFPLGPVLAEAKLGALLTVAGALVTIAAARLLKVAPAAPMPRRPRPGVASGPGGLDFVRTVDRQHLLR